MTRLLLSGIAVEVERKPIKHLHLSVYPPHGRVRIAAPERMDMDAIRVFAVGKLPWIRGQRRKLQAQLREPAREYCERESHYLWGRRYLLSVVEAEEKPSVRKLHRSLRLTVRPAMSAEQRGRILESWYRAQLRIAVVPLVEMWSSRLRVAVSRIYVQRMKTKWGSCNPTACHIRLNTELARKPPAGLEYVLLHEMAHLRYPDHGARFIALLDDAMPQWREVRRLLNDLAVLE